MFNPLQIVSSIVALLSLIIVGSTSLSFASELIITDMNKELPLKETFHLKNRNSVSKFWLKFEDRHGDYLQKIYWDDLGGKFSRKERTDLINKKIDTLINSAQRIVDISEKLPVRTENIMGFVNALFAKRPDIHIFLAISPVDIDAKTQWYKSDHNAVHINALSNTFTDPDNLDIILSHEFFHLYQQWELQLKNAEIDYYSIAGKIISEGMASFFSRLYNEDTQIDKLLLYDKRTYVIISSQRREIAKDMLKAFNSKDPDIIKGFFGYGKSRYPPRSGYYISYLAVENLIKKMDFKHLTELSPERLKRIIKLELKDIANS